MFEFKLPDVGEGIHEAEILQWLVKEGDTVTLDQPILEIQTDKAVVEIPAPVAGKIVEIRAAPGDIARVGDVLVVIAPAEGATPRPAAPETAQAAPAPP
ncbi:MAG: 2-oxo acid dehydrogenase subunit E2, partial [Caldilineae bacterium]